MRTYKSDSGQILLVTLLVMAVAITIALSLIGRTTTDTSINTQVEESSRAFSAAEAGIEYTLKNGAPPVGTQTLSDSNTTYNVTQAEIAPSGSLPYTLGTADYGQTKSVWLIPHKTDGSPDYNAPLNTIPPALPRYNPNNPVTVCWSNPDAALEVTVYYKTAAGSFQSAKIGFDNKVSPPTRIFTHPLTANNFTQAQSNPCGIGAVGGVVQFSGLGINANDTLIVMRLRPVYLTLGTNTILYVQASFPNNPPNPLPGLGNEIVSCGETVGKVTVCLKADSDYREPADVFDYVLYANSGSL